MQQAHKPLFSLFISVITILVSFYVAFQISGSIWGKARIIYLAEYGGITIEYLQNLEFWRLFSSQLIHVYQQHMLYNVLSFMLLGVILEKRIGSYYMFYIWFFAGALGTLFSTFFGSSPWNLGTGASQAVLGLTGFGLVFVIKRIEPSLMLKAALAFAILPAILLDIKSLGYPKPGHTLSFIIGVIISFIYLKKNNSLVEK